MSTNSDVIAPINAIEEAMSYFRSGLQPIPVWPGEKKPRLTNWQNYTITEAEIPRVFQPGDNIGSVLGRPLVDVDIDAPEPLALAEDILPPTGRVHGRRSKPQSHAWYSIIGEIPAPLKFCDTDGVCLVELRSVGQQTVVPPSRHPSGEQLVWYLDGEPRQIKTQVLVRAVRGLGACALIVRHWPAEGARHDMTLALAALLLKAGLAEQGAIKFISLAARAARDEEAHKREQNVISTIKRLKQHKPVSMVRRLNSVPRFGYERIMRG